jgi:hypothetical protein
MYCRLQMTLERRERGMISVTQCQKINVVEESIYTINFDNDQFPLWQRRCKTVSCETKDIYQKHSDQRI